MSIPRRKFLEMTAMAGAAVLLSSLESIARDANGKKLKIAIIGCGSVSNRYIPHLQTSALLEIVSLCDIKPERAIAQNKAYQVNAQTYPDIHAMLRGVPFDLMITLTDMQVHGELNKLALMSGKHVWSEKPMANTYAEGKALYDLANRKNLRIWGAPAVVNSPQFAFMSKCIQEGKLGRIASGHGQYGHTGPGWSAFFYEKSGGSMPDLGVYNIATLVGLLGPAKSIMAMTSIVQPERTVDDKGKIKVEAEDNAHILLEHDQGVISHVMCGFNYFDPHGHEAAQQTLHSIQIYGDAGNMRLIGYDWEPLGVYLDNSWTEPAKLYQPDAEGYQWQEGATKIGESLVKGVEPRINAEHALHVLEIIEAARKSSGTGKKVKLTSRFTWPMVTLLLFFTIIASSQSFPKGRYGDGPDSIAPVGIIKGLTDDQLLETVQKQTFRFFWHGAHPVSGLALERSNTVRAEHYWDYINEAWDEPNFSTTPWGPDAGAIGGTGFGIMSTIVAVERGWIGRDTAVRRLIKMADFLMNSDCFHGIYPHFMHGRTGKTIKFDRIDDGADIVETSYLAMGFLCANAYFNKDTPRETYLRKRINSMWNVANWAWHSNGENKLYWHWSPNNGFDMNFPVWGWNECLITYIMSASSQRYAISKEVYKGSWSGSMGFKNGKDYYGLPLPLGNYNGGGPLFFVQYTFMGIDPNGLKDDLGNDYWTQCRNHTLINRAYCIDNPKKHKGYSDKCWGLTAGDSFKGYAAHCPFDVDLGVIQPTAALSSMPFTPRESMDALRHFYYGLGDKIWSEYGFVDGFSEQHDWYAKSHIAIDQGPIIVMIENYRSGLLWKLFMKNPDLQRGLKNLGFSSPYFD